MGVLFCSIVMMKWFLKKECGMKIGFWNILYNVGGMFVLLFVGIGVGIFGENYW